MIFDIVSLFPEMFDSYLKSSILGKAVEQGKISVKRTNIRDFATDRHKTCDEAPFGGGPGMLLKPQPLAGALDSIGAADKRVVYLSPAGRLFNRNYAKELVLSDELVLICGHYEGIDQRIIDIYVDDEISLGNYVFFSGEVAAMVVIDTLARLVPGIIKEESLANESFEQDVLEYPQYTRPRLFRGREVPQVLLSGHHKNIEIWRRRKSLEKTQKNRPDLLDKQ